MTKVPAYSKESNPSSRQRGCYLRTECQGSVKKNVRSEPQGAWRQDEIIGGKPTVVKDKVRVESVESCSCGK
jgi:hypothetical protein